ncbi:MAG: CDP-alcohol phosphatidyltransferase family protein [Ruminococcaceae bacterium]|nr:CDP-alcohol phosphatidyltransferase family protein [Oscillospiraceae bacterium]
MYIKDWKKDVFTIPNMLSLFRLLLIPVYIVIYLNADSDVDYYLAGAILAVSCLTDLVDGQIARHFNMISTVGKVLDPLADKFTQFALIICLVIKYPILLGMMILFIVKEIFQLVAGFVALHKGKMLNGALISGKISTTVLFISLIVLVLFPSIDAKYVEIIMWVDTAVLLIAFAHYAITYFTNGSMIKDVEPLQKEEKE